MPPADAEEVADPFHYGVAERVSAADRKFKAEHPDAGWVIRPGVPHELCKPGGPCLPIGWVRVLYIADGVRRREAWDWGRAQ